MGLFNFFGDNEHKVFDYKPIYYDKEADERRRRFGAVDGSDEAARKEGSYVPGSYIKGSFRDGNYQRVRSHNKGIQTIIGIVTLLLIVAVLWFIAKFYAML